MINQSPDFLAAPQLARMAFLDLGAGVARIRGYAGDQPATAAGAPAGAPLFELPLLKPCATYVDGALQMRLGPAPLALATGLLGWARVVNGNGDTAFDMSAGGLGSTAELRVTTLNVTINEPVSVRVAALR